VLVNTGKYVQPQDVLFELVDPEDLHLMLTVYEKDMSRIHIGQQVEAHLVGQSKPLYARIILVTRNLDAQRRGEVHCHFDREYADILPGMYLEARVQTDSSLKWVLPAEAVVRNEGKFWVFTQTSPGVFQPISIAVEKESEGWWVLNDSSIQLLKDKKIVAHGAFGLLGVMSNKEEE
jgi:cobalt-zinc-cadmium efflux system membrane fusion protein